MLNVKNKLDISKEKNDKTIEANIFINKKEDANELSVILKIANELNEFVKESIKVMDNNNKPPPITNFIKQKTLSLNDKEIVETRESNIMLEFNNDSVITEDFCTNFILQSESVQTQMSLELSNGSYIINHDKFTSKEFQDSSKLNNNFNLINKSFINELDIELLFCKIQENEQIFVMIITSIDEYVKKIIKFKSKNLIEKSLITELQNKTVSVELCFTIDKKLIDSQTEISFSLLNQFDQPTGLTESMLLNKLKIKNSEKDTNNEFIVTGLTESISSLDSTEAAFYSQQRALLEIDFPEDELSTASSLDQSQPPVFHDHLNNTEFIVGEKAQLKCVVTGVPTPEISWFVDEDKIINDK